jgi:sigma-B regulation protein RsbU (phosphoserine phosphatase)
MKNKRYIPLSVKFVVGFMLMGLSICVVSMTFGYIKFKNSVQTNYNNNGYQIAEIVRHIVSDEEVAEYAKLIRDDIDQAKCEEVSHTDRYIEIENELSALREATGANDIYIGYLRTDILDEYKGTKENWYPLRYIFDVYEVPELKYTLGDASPVNPKFIDECREFMETGERPTNFFVSKSEYGYNTAAILPILSDGEVCAIIGVEIPMSTQQAVVRQHVLDTLLVIFAIVAVSMTAYILWFLKRIISPIKALAVEAESFTISTDDIGQDVEVRFTVSDKLNLVQTGDEIEHLAKSLYDMEKYIDTTTANLVRAIKDSERERSELGIASQIQNDILPSVFPAFPERTDFDIYASMTPAKFVAGDFYDFFLIDEDHLCAVIADVTGKGIPAALFMMKAKTIIKNRALQGGAPSAILHDANNQLCEGNDTKMFVTAWLCILDTRTGEAVFANAGHEYPVIKGPDAEYKVIKDKHGLVMGLKPGIRYPDTELVMSPGDAVFVYTDGVLDARNQYDEEYGIENLLAVLNADKDASLKEQNDRVLESLTKFQEDTGQFDDITMLTFKYIGGTAEGEVSESAERTTEEPAKSSDPALRDTSFKERILPAKIENTETAVEFVKNELISAGCVLPMAKRIGLAVEELFVNIASYAYPDGEGEAGVKVSFPEPDTVQIELTDEGVPYDPLAKEDPDITRPFKERQAGGLGIYMSKTIMDDMKYDHTDGCNHVVMTKKITLEEKGTDI